MRFAYATNGRSLYGANLRDGKEGDVAGGFQRHLCQTVAQGFLPPAVVVPEASGLGRGTFQRALPPCP